MKINIMIINMISRSSNKVKLEMKTIRWNLLIQK